MTVGRTLVSTNWLREQIKHIKRLKNQPIRVIETTYISDPNIDEYKDYYLPSHITHSQYFNFIKCSPPSQYFRRSVPDINLFTEVAQSLGINNDTHVVTYDRIDSKSAARTWWLFRLYGHRRISILDGGFNKWIADGFKVTNEEVKFEKGNFEGKLDTTLIRDYESMCDNLRSKKEQVMDSRGSDSFHGNDNMSPESKKGHFPGAKNIPFFSLFNKDGTFKSEDELKLLFHAASIDLDKPIISMCRYGLSACGLAVAGSVLGKETIPVYAGSMYEWGQKAPEEFCVKEKSS